MASFDGVLEFLQKEVAALLQIEVSAAKPDANLFDLGLDSILALELTVAAENRYQKEIDLRVIFLAPTLRGLAEAIAQALVP